MTRKDYKAIAKCIKEELEACENEGEMDTLGRVAKSLCGVFREDNGRFDRERFLIACGLISGFNT
jgi:hypothetical protein